MKNGSANVIISATKASRGFLGFTGSLAAYASSTNLPLG